MSGVKSYRKKPVVIEAIQYTKDNCSEIHRWMRVAHEPIPDDGSMCGVDPLLIDTLEGHMWASPGDFIIKGIKGEFYPCKPNIFQETYSEIEP